jgi:hypothetical protein
MIWTGQNRSSRHVRVPSAFPPTATKSRTSHHVGDGPLSDIKCVYLIRLAGERQKLGVGAPQAARMTLRSSCLFLDVVAHRFSLLVGAALFPAVELDIIWPGGTFTGFEKRL